MKTYHGYRLQQLDASGQPTTCRCVVKVRGRGDEEYDLPERQKLRNHSPTGLEWGYAGSGPAQLALALLCDVAGVAVALRYYQTFKAVVVAGLPHDGWTLTSDEIANHLLDLIEMQRGEA